MKLTMNKGGSKEELLRISKVRGLLCIIFMSDIITADSTYLEGFATARSLSREHSSEYNFFNEAQTQGDWTTWIQFLGQNIVNYFELATPLSEWIHHIHPL